MTEDVIEYYWLQHDGRWTPVTNVRIVFTHEDGHEDGFSDRCFVSCGEDEEESVEFRKGVERGDKDTREVEYQCAASMGTAPQASSWHQKSLPIDVPELKAALDMLPCGTVMIFRTGTCWQRVAPEERRKK